ncbi:hypothetical protein K1T71_007482 [Dendrolimus kikuchii]|uniref:Uncharacterized protein n=1 Tax=Dendrolimus kikuchii TaxID=765133 RepID=A0ACC1D0L7_9NEOP|nr:hypothetical protein K1T71_007482 [Dendrolimus kikuchii]
MISEILIFLLTTVLTYYLYVYKKIHWHFDKNGVKYLPGWPIFGNIIKNTFMKRHLIEEIDEVYRAFPDERYVGYIETTTPILLIRDPEIIKNITVKDFDHFLNHKELFTAENENGLLGSSLFMMKGDRWRDMRTTLSPAFTGSKMRAMMPFMMEISKNIVEYLKDKTSKDFLVDDLIRRYTSDVIASAGFGLQVNSLVDKDNQFYRTGQTLFDFTLWQRCCFFLTALFPSLTERFSLEVFPGKTTQFFRDIVTKTMAYRIQNNVERPDMIQLLLEATRGNLKSNQENEEKDIGFAATEEVLKHQGNVRKWKENELAAQVFLFFAAGFESTAATLVMCIHELALNPEVEEKLYQEVKEFKKIKKELTYENIGDLKYLDCVLNEVSRKWSIAILLDRVCNRPYVLPPPRDGGKPYMIKPGEVVYNVVNSIHMDPKYYPDPEKFDPDRFSDENKRNIKPFTFMPFGSGPRNCIGSRFAILELKVLLYNLILNYKVVKSEKTTARIKLVARDFNLKAVGGTWVIFEPRF